MTDFPRAETQVLPLYLTTWTARYSGFVRGVGVPALASITWPAANRAIYIPMAIPWAYPVKRVFWVNGSSVTSTNMDFGIYSGDGTLIYSTGSTVATPVSVPQFTSTDLVLQPGAYYFALVSSTSTTNRGGQGSTAQPASVARCRLLGYLQQASALPLPATMTPAAMASIVSPFCGVTRVP